jgi:hypothetical protein
MAVFGKDFLTDNSEGFFVTVNIVEQKKSTAIYVTVEKESSLDVCKDQRGV